MNKRSLTNQDFIKRLLPTKIIPLEEYPGDVHIKIRFKCYCGNEFVTTGGKILAGHTKSCGCFNKKKLNSRWKGYGEIGTTYINRIKRTCKKYNREYNLTIEFLWDLFLKQNRRCAYTGRELTFTKDLCNKPEDQTASLDRIDSKIGYIPTNVQWVHKDVNYMKQDYTDKEFRDTCKEIYLWSCKDE